MNFDPNILALLSGSIQSRVGMGGQQMLPQFSGGEGMDKNMLAMLMASGQLQKHLDMSGNPILPNAGTGSQFPGLDAYQALQQGKGSGLITPQTQPSPTMLPNGFSNNSYTVGQQKNNFGQAMQTAMNPDLFSGGMGVGGMATGIGRMANVFNQQGRQKPAMMPGMSGLPPQGTMGPMGQKGPMGVPNTGAQNKTNPAWLFPQMAKLFPQMQKPARPY